MKRLFQSLTFFCVGITALVPLLLICALATSTASPPELLSKGRTLAWFTSLFDDGRTVGVIADGCFVAILSSLMAVCLAWWGASRAYLQGRNASQTAVILAFIPCIFPPPVFGLALLRYYGVFDAQLGCTTLVIAHTALAAPLCFLLFQSRFHQLSPCLIGAARNLGGGSRQILLRLLLPESQFTLLAAFALSFSISWVDHAIAWYVGGFCRTIAIHVRSSLFGASTPEVYALSVVSAFVGCGAVAVAVFCILQTNATISRKESRVSSYIITRL